MAVDVSTSMVIRRPRHEVAAFAAKPDNAPYWYANIKTVRWLTTPPIGVGSKIAFVAHFLGRRLEYVYEVVEYVPNGRLVMRASRGPFPMETTYAWEGISRGYTLMTIRNRGLPSGFATVAAPALALAMRRANTKDLARLKAILEQGVRDEDYGGVVEVPQAS